MPTVRDTAPEQHMVDGDDTGTYRWLFADQNSQVRGTVLGMLAGRDEQPAVVGDVATDAPYHQVWGGRAPDPFQKTAQVADYADAPFLVLMNAEEEIAAYDLSYQITPGRMEELEEYGAYPDDMKQLVTKLSDNGVDTAYVYHLAVHPDMQGEAFGLQAPTIRQTVLEADWEDGETPPATDVYEHITGQQFTVDADPVYERTDAVLSLVRRYADKEARESSQVYNISRGFGFEDTGITQKEKDKVYSLMIKHDPAVADDMPRYREEAS